MVRSDAAGGGRPPLERTNATSATSTGEHS